jgi:hypothetical protein
MLAGLFFALLLEFHPGRHIRNRQYLPPGAKARYPWRTPNP